MIDILSVKKEYYPPEFEYIVITLQENILGISTDANTDHNNPGGLFDDNTNPDVNNDYYDLGDGDW